MKSDDLYEHGDSIVMSDLLEDFDEINLQGQQQDHNDEQFLGSQPGEEVKALIAELGQQPSPPPPLPPPNSQLKFQGQAADEEAAAAADYMLQSVKNEIETEQLQMVRSTSLQMLQQQQQQQLRSSEAVNLRGADQNYHSPQHFWQNLFQIKEGVYGQQPQNQMVVSHYRSCSDSASNSTVGLPKLMSPELSQTPTHLPQALPFPTTPQQIHRRARSEQLQMYGSSENELNQFFQKCLNSYNEQEGAGIDMRGGGGGGQGQIEPYIDANATHAALGHMYGPRATHRRMHSYDDTQTPSYQLQQQQQQQRILQSPSAEYPRMNPVANFQGYGMGVDFSGLGRGEAAGLNYKQGHQMQEMHTGRGITFPTSKKSSVQKRDRQLSPKSLKRVVANRESAKRSRERKEKYRRDMEKENQILKDTLQYLEAQTQQRQSKLTEAKQKNELLRQAVKDRLYMQRGSQSSENQQLRRNEHQKRSR